jgi:glutathione S-transferase
MPSYKLTYFNGRGRAETIRLVFAAAGIKYDDTRIEKSDWSALKAQTPWGGLPTLTVDGKTIGQSMAIARFVAKEGGLMGKNNFEAALIDSTVDSITELREKALTVAFTPDGPAKEAALADFKEKTLPGVLPNIEKILAGNPDHSGFLVGSKLSLADIHYYAILEMLLSRNPVVLANNPALKTLYDKVGATPKIAEYIKKRPETPF